MGLLCIDINKKKSLVKKRNKKEKKLDVDKKKEIEKIIDIDYTFKNLKCSNISNFQMITS